jgi:hypothetical protein
MSTTPAFSPDAASSCARIVAGLLAELRRCTLDDL